MHRRLAVRRVSCVAHERASCKRARESLQCAALAEMRPSNYARGNRNQAHLLVRCAPQRVAARTSVTFFAMNSARFSLSLPLLSAVSLSAASLSLPRLGLSLVAPDLYTGICMWARLVVKICAYRDSHSDMHRI